MGWSVGAQEAIWNAPERMEIHHRELSPWGEAGRPNSRLSRGHLNGMECRAELTTWKIINFTIFFFFSSLWRVRLASRETHFSGIKINSHFFFGPFVFGYT